TCTVHASGNTNQLNDTTETNKSISAMFAIHQYTMNVTTVGNGTVTKNPDQPLYDHGTIVDLTAIPATGWHFVDWSGDASGNANGLEVRIGGNEDCPFELRVH